MLHVQFIPNEFISCSNNITQVRGFWSTWEYFGTFFGPQWVFWGYSSLFNGLNCLLQTQSSSVWNLSKNFHQYCDLGSWLMFILEHAWRSMPVDLRYVHAHTRPGLLIIEGVDNPFGFTFLAFSVFTFDCKQLLLPSFRSTFSSKKNRK